MEINGVQLIKHCGYCEGIIPIESIVCPLCNKDLTPIIPTELINLTFSEIKELIANAFFRIESFMNGSIKTYKYFGFDDVFTKLFFEAKKIENFTYDNCKLICKYGGIGGQIGYDFEKRDFANQDASNNEGFCNDCNELWALVWNGDFIQFLTKDEIEEAERKVSITDILKREKVSIQTQKKEKMSEGLTKAEDYISYYNLLTAFPTYWDFNLKVTNAEFIENNPDYILDDWELNHLRLNEIFSLSDLLKKFSDEREMIAMLREIFDNYRGSGGEPLEWLYFTFENVSLNPHNYKAEHRGLIEKNLILWIENFTKQPFDSLAENIKYLNRRDLGQDKENAKILAPVFALFCSIVHQSGLHEMGFDESNEKYCQRISDCYTITVNTKKARQYFKKVMEVKASDKNLKKISEEILPSLPSDAKQKIDTFLNGKLKLYA
jgi:hypothetical protein